MSYGVTQWLEQLGLGQYAESFEENAIGPEHLPDLDHETLQEIGVRAVGHRMTILKAAADLKSQSETEAAQQTHSALPTSLSLPEAERRQLTVMFCDLVGSTELSQKLDPEDLREVNRAYQDACKSAIERYQGYIARYMGDGVLAYFGYPQAREDDAERAVHAGLGVVESVTQLNESVGDQQGIELGVRVGIATGPVVVGDLIGEGASQESAVVGETPNLAARLQALAASNAVVIGPVTHELAAGRFEYDDLGTQAFKGIAEPVHAWRVIAPAATESRFEATHRAGLTPLVGREHEIGWLLERWEQAREGEGQVVLLSGEAGIGKSRITEILRERTADYDPIVLRYQCSPYHTNSALHPVIKQLERATRFEAEDSDERKLDKLESLLAQGTPDVEAVAALFAALLSVPYGGRYAALNMTPGRQKERTLEALVAQLEGLSRHRPVLLVFEDVHWADPTSIELLELTIRRVQSVPVLAVITFRSEFAPPWMNYPHVTALTIHRLNRNLVAAMVEKVTGGRALPDGVCEEIVEKTDGVPLFVEELTKSVLELGLLETEFNHRMRPRSLVIPATLHDSLMARLDRLAPIAKQVTQIGAVIGREFPHELLVAVANRGERELYAVLQLLIESGLIYRRGNRHESTYNFKHALVRDAAYQSLLKAKRRRFHARVAEALEASLSKVGTAPELLAHHYTEAGLAEPAIKYWRLAGEQAARRAANVEALQHFSKALDLLQLQPESRERNATELRVLTNLGPVLMLTKGWAAPEVGAAYERARSLAGQLERSADLVPSLVGIWLFHATRGRFDLADEVTQELFHVAKTTRDSDLLLQAHHAAWPIPMYRGAFVASNEHIDKGLALYDYEQHKQHALLYLGHDPAVCAHSLGAGVVWALGFPDRAHCHATDALQLARRLGHAPTLAFALWFIGAAHAARGDEVAALSTAEELQRLSEEQKLVQTGASALIISGWAMARMGQVEEGVERTRAGLESWNRLGALSWLQPFKCLFAEQLFRTRRVAEALENLNQGLALGEQTGERWWESRIHHLRGQALLHSGDADSAVASWQTAIQVARAQKAKSWELRATTSLSRLWARQGKRHEAYSLLAPIYGWFTEGFDTADLSEAKALLDELPCVDPPRCT